MRKRWLIVPIMIGLLVTGVLTTSAVLAQSDGTDVTSPWSRFVSRVAEILGVDEAQVQDAVEQAAREMQDEALQAKLDRMVESGRLTQEEADARKEWYQSRPDGLHPGPFHLFWGPGFGMSRGHHFRGLCSKAQKEQSSSTEGSGVEGTSL